MAKLKTWGQLNMEMLFNSQGGKSMWLSQSQNIPRPNTKGAEVKNNDPVMPFTRVKDNKYNKEGRVSEVLSSQITVEFDDGTFRFLMNSDRNQPDGWHVIPIRYVGHNAKSAQVMSASMLADLEGDIITDEFDEIDAMTEAELNQFMDELL